MKPMALITFLKLIIFSCCCTVLVLGLTRIPAGSWPYWNGFPKHCSSRFVSLCNLHLLQKHTKCPISDVFLTKLMNCLGVVVCITFTADSRSKTSHICLSIETSRSLTVANLIKQASR